MICANAPACCSVYLPIAGLSHVLAGTSLSRFLILLCPCVVVRQGRLQGCGETQDLRCDLSSSKGGGRRFVGVASSSFLSVPRRAPTSVT